MTLADRISAGRPSVVSLPEGESVIDGTLTIPTNTTVIGYGATLTGSGSGPLVAMSAGSRLIGVDLTGTNPVGITTSGATRWAIRDVVATGFGTGIELTGTWIGSVRDCIVQQCTTAGIATSAFPANAILISGGEVKGCAKGVVLSGGSKLKLDSVTIENCDTHGLHLTGTTHAPTVRDCYFEANGSYDVQVSGAARALRLDGNFHVTTPQSVDLYAAKGGSVEGCFFNPGGATPKSLTIGSLCESVEVGRNLYVSGEFDPATDDDGANTTTR